MTQRRDGESDLVEAWRRSGQSVEAEVVLVVGAARIEVGPGASREVLITVFAAFVGMGCE